MTITLPNAISNVIDFNYFSIVQKALHISVLELRFFTKIKTTHKSRVNEKKIWSEKVHFCFDPNLTVNFVMSLGSTLLRIAHRSRDPNPQVGCLRPTGSAVSGGVRTRLQGLLRLRQRRRAVAPSVHQTLGPLGLQGRPRLVAQHVLAAAATQLRRRLHKQSQLCQGGRKGPWQLLQPMAFGRVLPVCKPVDRIRETSVVF